MLRVISLAFLNGSYPLKETIKEFREKSEHTNFYTRNYETSGDRANRLETVNRAILFDHPLYRDKDMPRTYFLRKRNHKREM